MIRKIQKFLKYTGITFLSLLIFSCFYVFFMTSVLKKDYANFFGYTYFQISSSSMSETIEVNDIILVKITKEVEENDIITFKNKKGKIITHRLVRKNGNHYTTKGDANKVEDETIEESQIIGKVKKVISLSYLLKVIVLFLIFFILFALLDLENIIKKYLLKDNIEKNDTNLPDTIFQNPKGKPTESTGLTITIAIDQMEELERQHDEETEIEESDDSIELLDENVEYVSTYKSMKKTEKERFEKETVEMIISLLKCRKKDNNHTRINKDWLEKYQYVYRLSHLLLIENFQKLVDDIKEPPFKEIYDYDLDQIGFTQFVRNRVYDMPIYIFFKILIEAILYNDEEIFDATYKILKYKIMVDKNDAFKKLNKMDKREVKQLKDLISFMQKIPAQFDNKNVFELEKIEHLVKIGHY